MTDFENGLPVLTEQDRKRKSQYIAGLREMADWLESHESMPAPACSDAARYFAYSKEQLAALRRASGLHEKAYDDDHFKFLRKFSGDWYACIYIEREQVCKRVKIGTKMLPPEPAKPEREVDVYEWQCEESVLASVGEPEEETAVMQ